MIIEKRDPNLKYTHAIKEEKMIIILDWLLEFRFSTIEILAERIGQTPTNANRFFNRMIKQKLIATFKNSSTANKKYFILTSIGVSYLRTWKRNVSKAVTRTQNLGKFDNVLHDTYVQKAVLRTLRSDSYAEVISDRNIKFDEKAYDRPDALLRSHKGNWVALEYERYRKSKKRVFLRFNNQVDGISKDWYFAVIYFFEEEADLKYYQNLFACEEWPVMKYDGKSGRVRKQNRIFRPSDHEGLRRRFVFKHTPYNL